MESTKTAVLLGTFSRRYGERYNVLPPGSQ